MLNDTQSSNDSDEHRTVNPLQRRRSNSVGSKRSGNDFARNSDRSKNLQKYASSGNLFENPAVADIVALENLFVNWYKDPKSVRNLLSRLHENNVFKTGLPTLENINNDEYYPPVMFLISSNLKIDNDYEIYTINNYDVRISEFMSWADTNKKELCDEYNKSLKAINQQIVDIANTDFDHDDLNKKANDEHENSRRHSEIMGLMIFSKNQPISSFLPNKTLNGYDVVNKVCDVFITDPSRRVERVARRIILSNDAIAIFTTKKAERLKYRFSLKHIYCGQCIDHQIQNIDSSLRIGGPYGDDLIVTFTNPNVKNEWQTAILKSISTALDAIKSATTEITILKNLEPNSSAPLVSKTFSIDRKTTGLDLKKKAIEGFKKIDKNHNDFILTFALNSSSRENVLHDDVIVWILREHIGCAGDSSSCTESCFNISNTNVLSHNPSRDLTKSRRQKLNPDLKSAKTNQYNLNEKWVDHVVPDWLMMLLSDVYHEGSEVEGIFRLSGVISKSDEHMQLICSSSNNLQIKDDIHTKASILKKFFGAIDGSIFTHGNKEKLIALSNEIISLEDFKSNVEQVNKLLNIIQGLPRNNCHLLRLFLVVIDHISKNETVNKMTLSNLSVCLAPTILPDMFEPTLKPDDYYKTNRLFECILSLFDKIVEQTLQKKIVALLKERKASLDSNSVAMSVEETTTNTTVVPVLITVSSGTVDEIDSAPKTQPLVPPRHKKADLENRAVNESESAAIAPRNLQRSGAVKKPMLLEMSKSLSAEMATDQTEAGDVQNNDNTNVKSRPQQKKRHSQDRHTVIGMGENPTNVEPSHDPTSKTPEGMQSSPFRRQYPVNRKHRDHSASNSKLNEPEPKPSEQTSPTRETAQESEKGHLPVLQKSNNDPSVSKQETSRSRERTRHYKPSEKSSKLTRTTFVFNNQPEPFYKDYGRPTSTPRVQTMIDDIEQKKVIVRTPTDRVDNSTEIVRTRISRQNNTNVLDRPSTEKLEKNWEALSKMTRNNNVNNLTKQGRVQLNKTGPIRPTRDAIEVSAQPLRRAQPPVVQRRNTLDSSLKKTLESSEDKDVTFI